eukprot:scaffold1007_cov364-Prasinococcus_capsulatus_cf.AAC.12
MGYQRARASAIDRVLGRDGSCDLPDPRGPNPCCETFSQGQAAACGAICSIDLRRPLPRRR